MYIQQIEQVQINAISLERMKINFLVTFSLSSSVSLLKLPTLCILSEPCSHCLVYLICLLVGFAGGRLNLKPQLEHNVINP